MKCFTTIFIATLLAMASAAPAATENAACNSVAAAGTSPLFIHDIYIYIFAAQLTAHPAPAASNNGTAPATGSNTNNNNNNGTAAAAAGDATAGTNVQKFTGSLGGAPPAVIQSTGDRPFSVNGDTFVGIKAALGRSCDAQHNACANAANSGAIDADVGQCDAQNDDCHAANSLKRRGRRSGGRRAAAASGRRASHSVGAEKGEESGGRAEGASLRFK